MFKIALVFISFCISASLFAFETGEYRGKNNEYKCWMGIQQEVNAVNIAFQCTDLNGISASWSNIKTYQFGNITHNPSEYSNYDLRGTVTSELLDLGFYDKQDGKLLMREIIKVSGIGQINFSSSLGEMNLYKE